MADAEFGRAVVLGTSVYAAMAERGWEAVLSVWHVGVMTQANGRRRGDHFRFTSPPEPATGPLAREADERWRRLCAARGVAPDDPRAAAAILEELGLLVEKRWAWVFKRMAVAEPLPDAVTHAALDPKTRRAAAVAVQLHRVRGRVADLVESGGGAYEAADLAAVASAAGTDESTMRSLLTEDAPWRVVDRPGGGIRLEAIPDDARQEMLDAIDALPDDPGADRP